MDLVSVLSSHSGSWLVVVLFQLKTMPLVTKSTYLHLFVSKLFRIYIVRVVLRELMTILCVLLLSAETLVTFNDSAMFLGHVGHVGRESQDIVSSLQRGSAH